MPTENVRLVRSLFQDWNRDGAPPRDALIADDFELHSPLARSIGHPFRGPTGVHDWVHEVSERYPGFRFELDELEQHGDRVLALGHIQAEGRGTGVGVYQPGAWVIDIADGHLTRMELFTDPSAARAALTG